MLVPYLRFFRKTGRLFFLAGLLLCLTFGKNKAQHTFPGIPLARHFGPEDYKAGPQNREISQDKRGLFYCANNLGMLEFDGINWQAHHVTGNTRLRSLLVASDERIYVGGPQIFGFFSVGAKGEWVFTSLTDKLPAADRNFDEVWRIHEIKGEIYFCTLKYIFKYSPSDDLCRPIVRKNLGFSFSVNGRLFVDVPGEGLFDLKNDSLKIIPNGHLIKDLQIASILPSGLGRLIIFSHHKGIREFDGNQIRPWGQDKNFEEIQINCAIRLRNDNLAIGTQNDGLLLYGPDGHFYGQISEDRGLRNRTVFSLRQDPVGNLWAGTNNGLSYIEISSPFSLINKHLGVPGTGSASLLFEGKLYLGTGNGLFYRPEGSLENFRPVKGSEGQVYHLSEHDGRLFMGHHQGAFLIENDRAVSLGAPPGAWKFMQLSGRPNRLLQGSYNGLLAYEKEGNRWDLKGKIGNFDESFRVFEQENEHTLWMTHGYKGAYRFRFSENGREILKTDFYGKANGFPSDLLINVFKIQEQPVFAAETGIYRYDSAGNNFVPSERLSPYFAENEHINELAEDISGNIYFYGTQGAGILEKKPAAGYERQDQVFRRVNSLINNELEDISPLSPDNVLIAGKEGFIHYAKNRALIPPDSFAVILRKISILSEKDSVCYYGNNASQIADLQVFSFENNSLKFEFSANAYIGSEEAEFSYFLEGFDKKWSDWSGKGSKEYLNLSDKPYTLRLKARSIYGSESEELRYRFAVSPPFYRSGRAYFLYLLVFSTGVFLLVSLLNQKYRRETQELERKQKQELENKDLHLKKLAEKSEATIQQLENEKLAAEVRYKTQELATATMNLLQKSEFMSRLKTQLNSVKNKSSKTTGKELEKIIKNIDQDISADDSWMRFEHNFAEVYGDFSERIRKAYPSLSPQDMKLCAYLRMNMSSKEIAGLLNISVRGVEIARYRLRKKLELEKNANLAQFILTF